MSCCDHDQDVLLLVHGGLSPVRRLLTEAHVRCCPRCRERRERFGAASGLLAESIRGRDRMTWRPFVPPTVAAPGMARARWALALSLLLAMVSIAAMIWRVREFLPAANASLAPVSGAPPEICDPMEGPLPVKDTPTSIRR